MTALSYRLLIIGPDEEMPIILPVWASRSEVWWFPGNYSSEVITDRKSIEELTLDDFPQWLLKQHLPMKLSPVRTISGETEEEASRRMFEALHAEAKNGLKAA